jgi:hypothetical protein
MDALDRKISYEKAQQAKKEAEEAARKAKEEGKEIAPITPVPEPVKIKKTKNVTIWQTKYLSSMSAAISVPVHDQRLLML